MMSCFRPESLLSACRSRLLPLVAASLLLGFGSARAAPVDEERYVSVGDIDEWIEIHGQSDRNPILLWINGGPGGSMIPNAFAYQPWENRFTMVMWDQRGEGKTFEKYGATLADTMTVERMSQDGIAVAEYLHKRMPKAKIVLLGHSWGTVLGIHMVRNRPDLFAAYVGTGQVTSLPKQIEATYPQLLAYAEKMGNADAVQELIKGGVPSSENPTGYDVTNNWSAAFEPDELPAMESTRQPPEDRPDYLDAGEEFSLNTLNDALNRENLPALGSNFKLPMFFIQGEHDFVTDTSKVREYYNQITAPVKRLVLLKDHGHLAIMQDRDGFLNTLVTHVLPVITPAYSGLAAGFSASN
ncbi:MAG TPA: alpha/beta hydrolase [Candidatus Acidoferrum sp.]|nr:alpha/beta hydrolase [Candidatus Acidoferrum sp.]